MNDLLIGLLSGAILASGTFTLRSWRRKHRLKQPWIQQPGPSEQWMQEKLELSQQLDQRQERIQSLTQELAERRQQFQTQQQRLETQQQALEAEQAHCQQLIQEREQAWDETAQVLDLERDETQRRETKLKELTQKCEGLQGQIIQLEQDLANAEGRRLALAHSLEEAQARLQTGTIGVEQFSQAIAHLLPNLVFLRDSMETMLQESPGRLNPLLGTLRALSDGSLTQNHRQTGIKVKKVHATHDHWSEIRFPGAGMIRIYFQKSKQAERYEVLITAKKDSKSQDQNLAWLKSQSVR